MKKSVAVIGAIFLALSVRASDMAVPKTVYAYSSEDEAAWYFDIIPGVPTNVVVWGTSSSSLTTIPTSLTNAAKVSGGFSHCVALTSNGTVVAWGDNSFGQCDVPTSYITNVVQILAGRWWSAALQSDGTGVIWGQFGTSTGTATFSNTVPVVEITYASTNEIFARLSNGDVLSIYDTYIGSSLGLSNVALVSAYQGRYAVSFANGTVKSWGGTATNSSSWATNVIAIGVGSSQTTAIKSGGAGVRWTPTTTGAGTPIAATNTQLSVYAANIWALKDGNATRYVGTIGNTNIPPLVDFSIGNGFGVGVIAP